MDDTKITYIGVQTYDMSDPNSPTTVHVVSNSEFSALQMLNGMVETFPECVSEDPNDPQIHTNPLLIEKHYLLTHTFKFILDLRRKELADPRPLPDENPHEDHFHPQDQDPACTEKMKDWEISTMNSLGVPSGECKCVNLNTLTMPPSELMMLKNALSFLQYSYGLQFIAYILAKILNGQRISDILKWYPDIDLSKFTREKSEDDPEDDTMDTTDNQPDPDSVASQMDLS